MHQRTLLEGLQHRHGGGEGGQLAASAIVLVLVEVHTAVALLVQLLVLVGWQCWQCCCSNSRCTVLVEVRMAAMLLVLVLALVQLLVLVG